MHIDKRKVKVSLYTKDSKFFVHENSFSNRSYVLTDTSIHNVCIMAVIS